MAYDEVMAQRIRELMAGEKDVRQMKMFGGLAFLVGGNMAIAASGQGGLMLRADPADNAKLLKQGAEMMVMRGKAMPGWLRVPGDSVRTKAELAKWVKAGAGYARSLPPK
jgi:TfoX/Sxy family transcriptional regulator of competence genes